MIAESVVFQSLCWPTGEWGWIHWLLAEGSKVFWSWFQPAGVWDLDLGVLGIVLVQWWAEPGSWGCFQGPGGPGAVVGLLVGRSCFDMTHFWV